MTKKNGNTWKIIAIVVAVAMAVVGWVWNAAVLSVDVGTTKSVIAEIEPKVDAIKTVIAQIEPKVEANETVIAEIEPKVEVVEDKCLVLEMKLDRLDEKLTEQKERQQAMLILQQQILDLVSE